jgi:hypothetical protein
MPGGFAKGLRFRSFFVDAFYHLSKKARHAHLASAQPKHLACHH